jgi:hypothetical protein
MLETASANTANTALPASAYSLKKLPGLVIIRRIDPAYDPRIEKLVAVCAHARTLKYPQFDHYTCSKHGYGQNKKDSPLCCPGEINLSAFHPESPVYCFVFIYLHN